MFGRAATALRRAVLEWAQGFDRGLMAVRRRALPAPLVLFEDLKGRWLSSALGLAGALELGLKIPENEPIDLSDLAVACQAPIDQLSSLLQVLDDHRYLSFDGARIVRTRLTGTLSPGQGGRFAAMLGSRWYGDCFTVEAILQGWRSGRVSFEEREGSSFFQSLSREPERARTFQEAMSEITAFCAPYLTEALPLASHETVLDIGGGDGTLGRALAGRYSVRVDVLDQEGGPSDGPQLIGPGGSEPTGARVHFRRGSFFDPIPGPYSRFLLKNILHDWDDRHCLEILRNVRRAASSDSRLEIFEAVIPPTASRGLPGAAHSLLDWNVVLTLGGRERTEGQFRDLLHRSGWRLLAVVRTGTPLQRLTAVPV